MQKVNFPYVLRYIYLYVKTENINTLAFVEKVFFETAKEGSLDQFDVSNDKPIEG